MTRNHTTWTGRIVYNRPRHYFSWKDVARVSRAAPDPATVEDALAILSLVASIYGRIVQTVFRLIYGLTLSRTTWQTMRDFIVQLLQMALENLDLEGTTRATIEKVINLL